MTRDPLPEGEDARLKILFQPAAVAVPDAGFSRGVMDRVARRAWQRRLLLGLAAACGVGAGVAVAGGPVWAMMQAVGPATTAVIGRLASSGDLLTTPVGLALASLVLVGPAVWQWLEN